MIADVRVCVVLLLVLHVMGCWSITILQQFAVGLFRVVHGVCLHVLFICDFGFVIVFVMSLHLIGTRAQHALFCLRTKCAPRWPNENMLPTKQIQYIRLATFVINGPHVNITSHLAFVACTFGVGGLNRSEFKRMPPHIGKMNTGPSVLGAQSRIAHELMSVYGCTNI